MMLGKIYLPKGLLSVASKSLSTSATRNTKVTVLGASGGIGQPLCLLLKNDPLVSELAMYDVLHSPGVAADLSHIATPCKVKGYGPGQIKEALDGAKLVICAAGQPRKAGQTREDQFNVNSRIVKDLAVSCAMFQPNAIYGIISNPINSTVPLFCDMFKKAGVFNENKIMGITSLGAVRTCTFVAQEKGMDPTKIFVPVIGGHSGVTIVPLLSQSKPSIELPTERHKLLILRVREAGVEIVDAKLGAGTVTLSMAWSAHKFANSVLRALAGSQDVIEVAYVQSNVSKTRYFSNPLKLGPNGVEKNLGMGKLTKYEQELLEECIPVLTKHIEAGEKFAAAPI